MFQNISLVFLCTLVILNSGCKKGGPLDEPESTAPTQETISTFQADSQGGWLSDCTTMASLNIPTLNTTMTRSSQIAVQSAGDGNLQITLIGYPSKTDCTLAQNEQVVTSLKQFKVTVLSSSQKNGLNIRLEPVEASCDKTVFNAVIKLNDNKQSTSVKLTSGQFRLSTHSSSVMGSACDPNLDAIQVISSRSPLINSSLNFKRTW